MKKRREIIYQYEAILEPNGEGFTVIVPRLPGLVTEGKNLKDAKEMTKDAIRCYLEAALKDEVLKSNFSGKKEKVTVSI